AEIAGELERIGKTRDADGEAGGGHRFTAEAGNEAIIAATAADGAEDHVLAFFVLHLEGQFDLEDRTGVIFEAADDGGVEDDATAESRGADQAENGGQFLHAGKAGFRAADEAGQDIDSGDDMGIAALFDAS